MPSGAELLGNIAESALGKNSVMTGFRDLAGSTPVVAAVVTSLQ
jgi:hypothetical protein